MFKWAYYILLGGRHHVGVHVHQPLVRRFPIWWTHIPNDVHQMCLPKESLEWGCKVPYSTHAIARVKPGVGQRPVAVVEVDAQLQRQRLEAPMDVEDLTQRHLRSRVAGPYGQGCEF